MRKKFKIKCRDCGTLHHRHNVYGKPCKKCGSNNLTVVGY